MNKILFQSFIRTVFLFIGMFLIYILSWLIFDYAFPISWQSSLVIFVVAFFIELIGALWNIARTKKQSQQRFKAPIRLTGAFRKYWRR